MADNDELNKLLKKDKSKEDKDKEKEISDIFNFKPVDFDDKGDEETDDPIEKNITQWASPDNKVFIPASNTVKKLPPGAYDIAILPNGQTVFNRIPVITEDLLRFPDSETDKVIAEVEKFWARKHLFEKHKILYKRGLILWGTPGGGKTCTIKLLAKKLIDNGGIVVKFGHPDAFTSGMRLFRKIQLETPVIVIMEDLDAILEIYNESSVLNILDGIDTIDNIVFIATTNYPEKLGARVINRPSRFDKRFKIGYPSFEARKMYLDHLFKGVDLKGTKINLNKWVEDTEDMSIAHIKELFVAVYILGDPYNEAIETLQSMKENISSDQDVSGEFGFVDKRKRKGGAGF